jgi:hypothetical protein
MWEEALCVLRGVWKETQSCLTEREKAKSYNRSLHQKNLDWMTLSDVKEKRGNSSRMSAVAVQKAEYGSCRFGRCFNVPSKHCTCSSYIASAKKPIIRPMKNAYIRFIRFNSKHIFLSLFSTVFSYFQHNKGKDIPVTVVVAHTAVRRRGSHIF